MTGYHNSGTVLFALMENIILPVDIIVRINKVLVDKTLPNAMRNSLLEELAADGLNAIFPELRMNLPKETVSERWRQLRVQLTNEPNGDAILRVLESGISGARFC